MALIQCNFYSKVLEKGMPATLIMPENNRNGEEIPVLYILHGLSEDNTAWVRNTSIERYVVNKNIAVIMPSVDRSFYTDMKNGYRYFRYMTDELPRIMGSIFRISKKREDNYIAGTSMGGYGALKIALTLPERFCAAANLSGAVDIAKKGLHEKDPYHLNEIKNIFGDEKTKTSSDDLFDLSEQLSKSGKKIPRLYLCCGTQDRLYDDNVRFRDHIAKLGIKYTYDESPGMHDWVYWDKKIQDVIDWMEIG